MAVRFRNPTSVKAWIIVSPPFHRCMPTFVSNPHSKLAENAVRVLRRRVEAYLYTGQPRFKRSKGEDDDMLGGAYSERNPMILFSG
jgi:hypothetical protein